MNELVLAKRAADWRRLKGLVLDSVSSPITKRVYNRGWTSSSSGLGRSSGAPEKLRGSKATPLVWKDEVILHRRNEVVGYDLKTGLRKWWVTANTQGAGTPTAVPDSTAQVGSRDEISVLHVPLG